MTNRIISVMFYKLIYFYTCVINKLSNSQAWFILQGALKLVPEFEVFTSVALSRLLLHIDADTYGIFPTRKGTGCSRY